MCSSIDWEVLLNGVSISGQLKPSQTHFVVCGFLRASHFRMLYCKLARKSKARFRFVNISGRDILVRQTAGQAGRLSYYVTA